MGSDVAILALFLWLIPVIARAGVLKHMSVEEDESPCRTYTINGLLHLDCSDRGLPDLPSNLNYDAQVLLLSNNHFMSFPEQLGKFSRVEVLDLSGNHLSWPLPSYVQHWEHLTTLNLSNNNYDTWISDDRSYTIKTFDLSKNKINNIDHESFTRMPYLHFLDLSENRIYDLPPRIFANNKRLDTLILSRNYFSDVPRFETTSLRSLHLSNCQIIMMNTDSFTGMSSLLEINLSINQIESIPDNLASNTLQELDFSYNEINSLNDRTFSSLPHLAVLDLRGNEFREVWSTSHFASNPFLREVHVKGNRWSCEGFSVDLLLTYEYLTKEPSKVADRASLICYSPPNVTQLSWQQAYIRTWHPNDAAADSYTTIAVMIGIIIGIMITSFVCRGMMAINKPEAPRSPGETTVLNMNGGAAQPVADSVVLRVPLHDNDLPPSYDEALLMPRLNSSFHSLPDFIDEDEQPSRRYRRSRSIGDLTEHRPRGGDRRSVRRTVEIHIT